MCAHEPRHTHTHHDRNATTQIQKFLSSLHFRARMPACEGKSPRGHVCTGACHLCHTEPGNLKRCASAARPLQEWQHRAVPGTACQPKGLPPQALPTPTHLCVWRERVIHNVPAALVRVQACGCAFDDGVAQRVLMAQMGSGKSGTRGRAEEESRWLPCCARAAERGRPPCHWLGWEGHW